MPASAVRTFAITLEVLLDAVFAIDTKNSFGLFSQHFLFQAPLGRRVLLQTRIPAAFAGYSRTHTAFLKTRPAQVTGIIQPLLSMKGESGGERIENFLAPESGFGANCHGPRFASSSVWRCESPRAGRTASD